MPSPASGVAFADLLHGAFHRVGKTDTAYYHRDAACDLVILASWTDPAETDRHVAWTRELFQAMQPQLPPMVYVNTLVQDESAQRVREAYGENYARLVELKTEYDPTNFFRMNQNINPA